MKTWMTASDQSEIAGAAYRLVAAGGRELLQDVANVGPDSVHRDEQGGRDLLRAEQTCEVEQHLVLSLGELVGQAAGDSGWGRCALGAVTGGEPRGPCHDLPVVAQQGAHVRARVRERSP